MELSAYHGTFWEKGEEFFSPSTHYSDLEAIFVSNAEEVAKKFATYHIGGFLPEDTILVIMRGESKAEKAFTYDPVVAKSLFVKVDTSSFDDYHISNEREELFEEVKRAGYDAFIIKNNYPEGDDIALFNEHSFSAREYSLSKDGKEWSDWMSFDNAVEYFHHSLENKADMETEGFSP